MTCTKCENRGYYMMLVTPASTIVVPGQKTEPEKQMMFCACEAGRDFRNLTIEFRLGDLEDISSQILPALSRAQTMLHNPDEARKEIQAVINGLEMMLDRIRRAFADSQKV